MFSRPSGHPQKASKFPKASSRQKPFPKIQPTVWVLRFLQGFLQTTSLFIYPMRKILTSVAIAFSFLLWMAAQPASAAPTGITALTLSPGVVALTADQTTTFSLLATLQDGSTANVTEEATWTPNGGGFTGIPGQKGSFTAVAQGTWKLTATVSGLSATTTITIAPGAPVSLNVLPTAAQLTADGLLPMEFYGVDADGNGYDVSTSVALSTSDPNGSVSPTGYTPGTVGSWKVTAVLGTLTDSTDITVTPGMLKTLTVNPGELALDAGDTAALTARGLDAKGNDTNSPVTWRVTNDDVATIDAQGNVKGKTTGQTNIIAEAEGGTVAVLPVTVAGELAAVTPTDEVIAVTKPIARSPQVAAEEVERVPDVTDTSVDEAAISTPTDEATACKNIAHPWTIILLIAHLILLSVFFTVLHRGHRYPWWWIPPIALTAAFLGVYAGAFCSDTYLWWPWSIVGITVIFLSVYYQRLDEPGGPPPKQNPPA